jgi:methylthioribose-1-phosphate isomerase
MRAIEWSGTEFRLVDQTLLPHTVDYIVTDDYTVIIDAIRRLAVRGAPAIGIAAAFGLAFAAKKIPTSSSAESVCRRAAPDSR